MPRVSVVLPAALSPAMASMTGRGGSGTDSLRRSRMSLSGISLIASLTGRLVRPARAPSLNWTFQLKQGRSALLPPRRGDQGGAIGPGSPALSTPRGDVPGETRGLPSADGATGQIGRAH